MTSTTGGMRLVAVTGTVPFTITPAPIRPLTRWELAVEYLRALYL